MNNWTFTNPYAHKLPRPSYYGQWAELWFCYAVPMYVINSSFKCVDTLIYTWYD